MPASKKTSLIILAVTALVCSRVLFAFFDDPEGPNLLIVVVLAVLVYVLSAGVYLLLKQLWIGIAIQLLSVVALYFCMR